MLTSDKSEASLNEAIVRDKLRFWQEKSRKIAKDVSVFNENPDRASLFFFHGDWEGGGFYTHKIARALGEEQPLVALAPQGMNADPAPPTIEQMAAYRLPLLRKMNPQGPFRLGGYCNGALIAYEAARQLAAEGRQIDFVAMIDPPTVNARPTMRRIYRGLAAAIALFDDPPAVQRARLGEVMNVLWASLHLFSVWLPTFAKASWSDKRRMLDTQLMRAASFLNRKTGSRQKSADDEIKARLVRVEKVYNRALARYMPEPSDIPVLLLNSGVNEHGLPDYHYKASTWRNISRIIDIRPVAGTHLSCVHDHASEIAASIKAWSRPRASNTGLRAPPSTPSPVIAKPSS